MRPTTAYITSSYGPRYLTTFIIQRNVSLDQVASGSAGSVRVIDGDLFIFTVLVFKCNVFTSTISCYSVSCFKSYAMPLFYGNRCIFLLLIFSGGNRCLFHLVRNIYKCTYVMYIKCMQIPKCLSYKPLLQPDLSNGGIHFLLQFPTISGQRLVR